jgi:protein TonB
MDEARMAYRAAENPDRIKALGGVAVVHAGLAAIILSGLTVHTVSRTVERLKSFDIREIPPPPQPPPPSAKAERARNEEGAAGKKALPTPVVAPQPKIVVPYKPPVTAARIASTGSASTAGAAVSGSGTGAGGSGNGLGGGGSGDFSGYTPAQRISRIPDREYRHLVAASGRRYGSVGITLKVNTDGSPSNCRIVRSSGAGSVDSLMCRLAQQYVRFRPARDSYGRPVAQDVTWYPDWSPNF